MDKRMNLSQISQNQPSQRQELTIQELSSYRGNTNQSQSQYVKLNKSKENYSQISQSAYDLNQNSQAIAGAMKALQNKVKDLNETNNILNQQNQQLQQQLQECQDIRQREKQKFAESMLKQKHNYQSNEKSLKLTIDDNFKHLEELKYRVEQSTKALDKLLKENLTLKKLNCQIEKQTEVNNQDNFKKIMQIEKVEQEITKKYKKKAKRLIQEKKELAISLKNLSIEYERQRQYFEQLITDLEVKLQDVIKANKHLELEYQEYRQIQEQLLIGARSELQQLKNMIFDGKFQIQNKESENLKLKQELQMFQNEVANVKNQVIQLQKAHITNEQLREETENFVSDVVNVNDMLVQSIQNKKIMRNQSCHSSIAGEDLCGIGVNDQFINQSQIKPQCPVVITQTKKINSHTQSMANLNLQPVMKIPSSKAIITSPSVYQSNKQNSGIDMEAELTRFQDKYNALLRDIEATKMPLQTQKTYEDN